MSHARMLGALVVAVALFSPSSAGAAERTVLLSLGDSYAAGYQATGPNQGRTTRNGFAYLVPGLARRRGYDLALVNLACGGATTTSMLRQTAPCAPRGRGPDGRTWGGRTQLQAAERYLKSNRDRVALVTVSIGGNDVTSCAQAADPVACVGTATAAVKRNVTSIARRLRAAAGSKVRIVGITYPNVILGQWVGADANQQLASLSVVAFRSFLNPALKASYGAAGGRFVDVTTATGGYTPLEQTTTLAPYGTIPVAVAQVCRLTAYCTFRDIHPTTAGYRLIADLVARTLPRRP